MSRPIADRNTGPVSGNHDRCSYRTEAIALDTEGRLDSWIEPVRSYSMQTPSLEQVLTCPTLPSLPAAAMEVLALTRDPAVSMKAVADVVQNDQALASKILKTVNSSFYGLSKPCPTISRAIGYLGLNTVKSLVLGFSLVDTFSSKESDKDFDYVAYWRRGVYSAVAARLIATRTKACDPEEAFIAALLQDVGMLAIYNIAGKSYARLLNNECKNHESVTQAEHDAYQFTHGRVGAELGRKWHIPAQLVAAIEHHHQPEKADDQYTNLVKTVVLANIAEQVLFAENTSALLREFESKGAAWFKLTGDILKSLPEQIAEGAGEISRLFQVNTGDPPDIAALRAQAGEQLVEHALSQDREKLELERQTTTDGLTGAFNRKYFDLQMTELHADALTNGSCLSVLFVDVDKFKLVNDTHGHQAGDVVLVELAARFQRVVSEQGIVCRYGGEEFAVIVPNAERTTAVRLAESMRKDIEATPFDLSAVEGTVDELPVTVSIGVAALEPSTTKAFPTPERLVQAADKAVYAAKEGGRNCVRVISPKSTRSRSNSSQPATSPQPNRVEKVVVNSSSSSAAIQHTLQSNGFSIVLVEDDPLVAQLVVMALRDLKNTQVHHAITAEEGLELIDAAIRDHHRGPDLVLLDLNLPGMSGLELLKKIRCDETTALIPVVIISVVEDEDEIRRCLRAGANAFISKVNLCDDIVQRVQHIAGFWTSTARVA